MGFIEKLSGSSLLLSLLTGLGIAVCVIAIIWLIMLAGENIAKSARGAGQRDMTTRYMTESWMRRQTKRRIIQIL